MAITNISGTFVPYKSYNKVEYEIVDKTYMNHGDKVQHIYDCKSRNEDPSVIVKWCRRNFGERGVGWDFLLTSGNVTIIIWDDKFKTMYELWKI